MPTYLGRVSPECTNVFLHPRDGGKLVLQPKIHRAKLPRLCPLWESKWPNTVVETDVDDRCSLDHGQRK